MANDIPHPTPEVAPGNPCPFLRALVANAIIDGRSVPLDEIARKIVAISAPPKSPSALPSGKIRLVALIAHGLAPWALWRTAREGLRPEGLRDGPLDKHGAGSRTLDAHGRFKEAEFARLAAFGGDKRDATGGVEPGLDSADIVKMMDANFERAKGARRVIDRKLMDGEWPVLLQVMGKGKGAARYLSLAELRALIEERRLPARLLERVK